MQEEWMFLKYSRTEDLLAVRPKPKWRYESQWNFFFLLPFRKIVLGQQLQLVLPTIIRRVVLSKLREKIKKKLKREIKQE